MGGGDPYHNMKFYSPLNILSILLALNGGSVYSELLKNYQCFILTTNESKEHYWGLGYSSRKLPPMGKITTEDNKKKCPA